MESYLKRAGKEPSFRRVLMIFYELKDVVEKDPEKMLEPMESEDGELMVDVMRRILNAAYKTFSDKTKKDYEDLCRGIRFIGDAEFHEKVRNFARKKYPKVKIEVFRKK